ncbi:MAG: sugar ABC transporter substrate-binding protein [bacterium]
MKILLTISTTVILFLLAGCQRERSDVEVLKFWALGNEGENVQKLIPAFEQKHPHIKVIVQQIPWIAAHEKLLTAFAGNSLPDLCQLGNTWIPEFSSLGALHPLNYLVSQSSIVRADRYFEGIWDSNLIDSIVLGIPWYVDTRVLFYRKDILTRAGFPEGPRTWQDVIDASERIVKSDTSGKRYAIFFPTNEWVPSVLLGLEAGSSLLRENTTRGDFSGREYAKAFNYLRLFYKKHYSPSSMQEVSNVYQAFAEGYFSMYITGPWNIGEFQRRLPPEIRPHWMTTPLPGASKARPGLSLPGGSSLVIFSSSLHKSAAWELIEYLSSPSTQHSFYQITGNLPAQRDVWNDTSFTKNQLMRAFYIQLQYVNAPPKIPEWEQIAMKLQEYAEIAAQPERLDNEILKELDREIDRILEKRRWLYKEGKLR